MTELTWYVNVEDSSGTVLGDGPIVDAYGWEYTAALDRAGTFKLTLPATAEKATLITRKRILRAFALMGGSWAEVGAGIVDKITRTPQANGTVTIEVTGPDLIGELNYRTVGTLAIRSAAGAARSHAQAVASVGALAPAGWTFVADATPPNGAIYGRFNGETVLAAALAVGKTSKNHIYRGSGRTLTYGSVWTDSGITAVQARGDLAAETCAIVSLTELSDNADLITRIYPRGSGNGDVQLTLASTTRTAPAGYTLVASSNYIESIASTASYGLIERTVAFRHITPVSNTAADVQSASDMLFDEALEDLRRRTADDKHYTIELAGCSVLLRPLQSVGVVYTDGDANINIQADLNILESTWSVGPDGVQTTGVVVTTGERTISTDRSAIADSIETGHIYQATPQLSPNAYVICYTKNVDDTNSATFRFRLGAEVVQLQQVTFDYQVLRFESTVTTIAGATSGSGVISSTTPSVNATSANNNSTGLGGGGNTGAAGTGDTGAAGTGATGSSGTGATGSGGTGNTGDATSGDTLSAGQHQHTTAISNETGGTAVTLKVVGGTSYLACNGYAANIPTSSSGSHVHTGPSHTHTGPSHTHTGPSHFHSGPSHSHSLGDHSHTLSNHTHDLSNHTHDLSESLTAVYGIYREKTVNTYASSDLEYRVNGGAWTPLPFAVLIGYAWYRVDLTAELWDPASFRPLYTDNTIEIRRETTAPANKTCTIDAQLNVRNVIQSVIYSSSDPR